MRVAVVGGGVAGLGAALALSRLGAEVTVLERDDTPLPTSADEAFEWDRRGAPQVRHSHAFLARLHNLLRDHYPEVLAELLRAGATEMRFGEDLPPTMTGFEPMDGDDDLVMLACRRTTFEWVLRKTVLAAPGVDIRDAVSVAGLLSAGGTPPLIRGVRLGDGTSIEADLVVVATGRRSTLPEWLAAVGSAEVPDETQDTGIMYLSRFYRLTPGAEFPPRVGPIGGDLGYLKYGVFVGDNRTFSITLAVPTDDLDLRHALSQADTFDMAASLLTPTAPWIADGRADPLTDVHTMSGLINRERRFVVDGVPLAVGVHAVGDARLCTNPLYGRGCSTGFWSAHLLAQVIAAEPDDLAAQAVAFDRVVDDEIGPFYRSSVAQDREARRVAGALLAGKNPDDADDPRSFMRSVFRDGLLPAMRTEPAVLRAFFRTFNLLSPPESLIADPEVSALVLAAWQQRDQRPPEPSLGPDRAGLLALLP